MITLIKPHYEAPAAMLRKGILPESQLDQVMQSVENDITAEGFTMVQKTTSPIKGAKGNTEVLALLGASDAKR